MELICPNCKSTIKAENINISTDLAKCDGCNSIHKASALVDIQATETINDPPPGTKIELRKGYNESIELFFPGKGFTMSMIPMVFFSIFWLGFISFWTWGASQGSIFFALFSIPFWIIGLSMIFGIANAAWEKQIIELNHNALVIKKDRIIGSKKYVFELRQIQSVRISKYKTDPFSAFGNLTRFSDFQKSFTVGIEFPAVISGIKTVYFFEDTNEAEQEWVTKMLDNLIKKLKQ